MAVEQEVYRNATYNVASTGTLVIQITAKHNYTSLSGGYGNAGAWQLSIYVDGQMQNYAFGSGGITDAPVVTASVPGISAGNHDIRIGWYGATNMILLNVNITVQVFKK